MFVYNMGVRVRQEFQCGKEGVRYRAVAKQKVPGNLTSNTGNQRKE